MSEDVKEYLSDYPQLLAEWDCAKNVDLDPQKIRHRSKTLAWWVCSQGHEWQSQIGNRTSGSACPYCVALNRARNRVASKVSAEGSLATNNPQLAAEWHPTKNESLKATDITASSNKKVWWRCASGHEWQASVANRNNNASKCPYCSGRKVIQGVNDLATEFPLLAAEWHPFLNSALKPSEVKPGSNKKVWWKCSLGHEWKAEIKARRWGNGCPECDKIKRGHRMQLVCQIETDSAE